jgi:ribonuclease G
VIINVSAGETRVAILEQSVFAELHIEREHESSVAGLVTLGKVSRVLPGMQAAFVDIGLEKAAFLYVGDYHAEPGEGENGETEAPRRGRGRNGGARNVPKIENVLREGQEILVQVAKEPIGTKGARITSHVSIAGRHLVLTPWSKRVGVSRRIEGDRERRRLRDIVSSVRPKDLGFIIRTAGDGVREADIEADVRYLSKVWSEVQEKKGGAQAPAPLYNELSLPLKVIRDFSNQRTKRIVIDDDATYAEMKAFLDEFVADPKPTLEHYKGDPPIFDAFGIEARIDENLGKKVWLKSGGHLVVDQSEALTAVDVNTGRYVGKRDLEETVLKTNLEAVKEIVHQLRFRNIGGLIILDLIDMESAENRDKVNRALAEALRHDKAKTNILKISELGLVEMTRKRTRESLVQQLCEPCSYCDGRGYVLSGESVGYKVLREIRKDLPRFCGRQIAVAVSPEVAEVLLGPARKNLAALSEDLGREVEVRARPGLHQEQFEVTALDEGPPVEIPLRWLGAEVPEPGPPLTVTEGHTSEEGASSEQSADSDGAREDPAESGEGDVAPAGPTPEAEPEPSDAAAKADASPASASASAALEPAPPETTGEATEPDPAPEAEESEDETSAVPADSEATEPTGGAARIAVAEPLGAVASPIGAEPEPEMLDGEEENPILPRFQRSEES